MNTRRWKRKVIIYSREVRIRMKSFRLFILMFSVLIITGATLISSRLSIPFIESLYESLALLFFSTSLSYPSGDYLLQALWLVFPLTGLLMLADGLTSIGQALKMSDYTSEEYNLEMARIMKNHIIIVGIGNVGLKLLKKLIIMEEDVVVIDIDENSSKDEELEDYQLEHQMSIIKDDATRIATLEKAGVSDAKAIYIVIDNDLLNIKIAMRAKQLNPGIRTIVRIYDTEFGNEIGSKINIDKVISTSSIAIPHFIDALE